jgi:hypothetical protein
MKPLLLFLAAGISVSAQINSTGSVVAGQNATTTLNNGSTVSNPSAFSTSIEINLQRKLSSPFSRCFACSLLITPQNIGISSLDLFQRQQSPPPFLQLPFPPASWFPHLLFTILLFQRAIRPLWYQRMKVGNSHLDFGGVWHLQPTKLKVLSRPKDAVPPSGMYLPTELPRLQLQTILVMLEIINTISTNKVCACHDVT